MEASPPIRHFDLSYAYYAFLFVSLRVAGCKATGQRRPTSLAGGLTTHTSRPRRRSATRPFGVATKQAFERPAFVFCFLPSKLATVLCVTHPNNFRPLG